MSTKIKPAENKKGKRNLKYIYIVNGIHINIKNWRNGQRYGLTAQEIKDLNQYIKDYKLDLR